MGEDRAAAVTERRSRRLNLWYKTKATVSLKKRSGKMICFGYLVALLGLLWKIRGISG